MKITEGYSLQHILLIFLLFAKNLTILAGFVKICFITFHKEISP